MFNFSKNPTCHIYQNIVDSKHESGGIEFKKHIDKNLKILGTENIYLISNAILSSYFGTQPSFLIGCFILHLKNHILKKYKK